MKRIVLAVAVIMAIGLIIQCAQAENLDVTVTGIGGTAGKLRAVVWKKEGFLGDLSGAVTYRDLPVSGTTMTVRFTGLERGTYAVSSFHDANANGLLDQNMIGKPTERYGFSNDARRMFSAPAFSEAAFELAEAQKAIRFAIR